MHRQHLTAQPNADNDVDTSPDLTQLDLAMLIQRCNVESNHFYRSKTTDTRFAYELFRRALVERNEVAWDYIYTHYSPLVESWIRRCGAFARSGETSEFFVVAAFTKFWRAITTERFASFQSLAALLQYLQLCASCVVIDSVRTQSWAEIVPEAVFPTNNIPPLSPDEEALERLQRQDFWNYVNAQLHDEAERVVVFDTYVLSMKPCEIQQRHLDMFGCVRDVYNVKRNVLERLSRDEELKQMLGPAASQKPLVLATTQRSTYTVARA